MRQYLDMLEAIALTGTPKHPSRAESGETTNATIGLPNLHFSYDLRKGFPLLTTRKIHWQSLVGELRSFLEGCTTHEEFANNNCNFWKPWAREDGSLGPIYGKQWNNHGQLAHVLHCLRERPTDRRMVVSAWRPDEHDEMVLPPCHLMWVVTPYNRRLNLSWIQRSCDFPIGVPFNIASYALLTHLLARWAGMEVGQLDCIFCDSHIYENQLEGVHEQLSREPTELPELSCWFNDSEDFSTWNCELHDYSPQPNISFGTLEV